MNKPQRIHSLWPLLCLCLVGLSTLQAQDPDIEKVAILDNEVNLRVQIHEALDALVNAPDPHYTSFWIYGDGHYVKDLTPIFNNSLTGPIQSHRYAHKASFETNVYLLDRYSNHAPPPLFANPSVLDITDLTHPATNQNPIIDLGRMIEIDTNHNARPNHKTVYVVSYLTGDQNPSNQYNEGGHVLFFYNGKMNGNIVDPSPNSFTPFQTHLPHYSSAARLSPSQSTIAFDGINGTDFKNDYADVIRYQYNIGEIPKDGANGQPVFPEGRLFHALENDPNLIVGEDFRFMAVVTGSTDQLAVLSARPDWGEISALAPTAQIGAEFIQDFYTIEQPVVEAHDPNKLYITDICQCADDDYEIEYTLEFCNDGTGRAIEAYIRIFDKEQIFRCYDRQEHFPAGNINTTFPNDPGGVPHQWSEHLANIFLAPAGKEFDPDDEKSCGKLVFTLITDKANVENLIHGGHLPLEACVTFVKNGEEVCAYSKLTRCEDILDDAGQACEPNCVCNEGAGDGKKKDETGLTSRGSDTSEEEPDDLEEQSSWPPWLNYLLLGLVLLCLGFFIGQRKK